MQRHRVPGAMQRVALREVLLRRTGTPVRLLASGAPALQRTAPQVLRAALRPGHGARFCLRSPDLLSMALRHALEETMTNKPAAAQPSEQNTFDYIIVGAGSAGCVLANRLSASGKHTVLLLEAGPRDRNIWIHVPLGYGKLFKAKSVNWMYQTEPEPGLNGRSVFQPRGKVLGGSSSINGLLYVRGQHEDYDRWRQLGNTGWGFDDVLPYFKAAEDQQRGADEFHGVGGPLPVSDTRHPDPLSDAFIRLRPRPALRKIPTSTVRPRKAPAGFRPRRGADGGRARRGPIFARRGGEATCTSRRRRWRSVLCSRVPRGGGRIQAGRYAAIRARGKGNTGLRRRL